MKLNLSTLLYHKHKSKPVSEFVERLFKTMEKIIKIQLLLHKITEVKLFFLTKRKGMILWKEPKEE